MTYSEEFKTLLVNLFNLVMVGTWDAAFFTYEFYDWLQLDTIKWLTPSYTKNKSSKRSGR